ncbi:MAG: hypothetical protein DIU69_06295 [Bacillota bacterium]|nr:MAG: hypothetical protein DIU69_06295 [Bacillota bacterium]
MFDVLRKFPQAGALRLLGAGPLGTFLELAAGWGWSEAYAGQLKLPLRPPESSGPAWALNAREPVIHYHGPGESPYAVPEPVREAGVQVSMHLPMLAGDRATGVLVVEYLARREVSEDQVRIANLVAGVAAVAVERALAHQRNRELFQRVPVGLYRSTPDGRLLDVNDAMVRMLGYPDRDALLAVHATRLYANPEDRARWQDLMDREGVVAGFEVQWRRRDGTLIWVREASRVVRDAAGRPAYYEGSAEDITVRKRVEADLQYLASHDPLTGAYNRHRFQEELHRLVARARRTGESGALLFIDLDNFKEVNDRLGHKAGDDLLRAVVRDMRARLRETDLLARLGGDEFGVAVAPVNAEQAMAVARRILDAVREQVVLIGGRPVRLTASCGVALFPDHGLTVDEVLAAADLSMYVAKGQGGDRAVLYERNPAWRERFHTPLEWSTRLQSALAEDRLVAFAQPILDLRRNRVVHCEFLVRMEEGGAIISPAAFLPLAERLRLIQKIDAWICREALRFAARHKVGVHINLSPRTLEDEETVREIVAALDAQQEAAARLVVEITETAAVADVAQTLRCLEVLRSRGCKLALDDFGVGFSSLYYLRHMPVDYLKIDASFIRDLVADPQDRHIVRAIADMARGLGKATIAEGVEDEATLQAVRALGVDYAQGHHIGRPVPAGQLLQGPLLPEA